MMPPEKLSIIPKDRIIFALDFTELDEAVKYIKLLKNQVGLFKIGWTLFIKDGLNVIKTIQDITGSQNWFFDAKLNDIPHQLSGLSSVLLSESQGVKFVTVHTSEGERLLKAVVDVLNGSIKVLGITVLTSLSEEESRVLGYQISIQERVITSAKMAQRAGCQGVVCSGHEAKAVKKECGSEFIIVTPGIRPSWARIPRDDQCRVMTPGEAIKNSADYIVVGRPISWDKDPVGAANKIAEEIEKSLLNQ